MLACRKRTLAAWGNVLDERDCFLKWQGGCICGSDSQAVSNSCMLQGFSYEGCTMVHLNPAVGDLESMFLMGKVGQDHRGCNEELGPEV